MKAVEVNKHVELIRENVFHTFPYGVLVPNFKGPHAEDCMGCIVDRELKILQDKIVELSPVEDIKAELEDEKAKVESYVQDRNEAFEIAGVENKGSVTDLVSGLLDEKRILRTKLNSVKHSILNISATLDED